MNRPRLLDLFCGAGGAATGYHRAGFEIIGVDIAPQKHYPFTFIQADALSYCSAHGHEYHAIHASPPCQKYSQIQNWKSPKRDHYLDLVDPTRAALIATGRPWIIENVPGSPLRNYVTLCGSSFGLEVRRHRRFESSIALLAPPCRHDLQPNPIGVYGSSGQWGKKSVFAARPRCKRAATVLECQKAMGMDWGTRREVCQAVPPAYTEFLGRQLIHHLTREASTA